MSGKKGTKPKTANEEQISVNQGNKLSNAVKSLIGLGQNQARNETSIELFDNTNPYMTSNESETGKGEEEKQDSKVPSQTESINKNLSTISNTHTDDSGVKQAESKFITQTSIKDKSSAKMDSTSTASGSAKVEAIPVTTASSTSASVKVVKTAKIENYSRLLKTSLMGFNPVMAYEVLVILANDPSQQSVEALCFIISTMNQVKRNYDDLPTVIKSLPGLMNEGELNFKACRITAYLAAAMSSGKSKTLIKPFEMKNGNPITGEGIIKIAVANAVGKKGETVMSPKNLNMMLNEEINGVQFNIPNDPRVTNLVNIVINIMF